MGILIDQNFTADTGVFVDFFGVPACTGAGFAKLAARSGAAVIPGFALWSEEERRYVLRFYPPVPMTGDAARDTAALQAAFEEYRPRASRPMALDSSPMENAAAWQPSTVLILTRRI